MNILCLDWGWGRVRAVVHAQSEFRGKMPGTLALKSAASGSVGTDTEDTA